MGACNCSAGVVVDDCPAGEVTDTGLRVLCNSREDQL